jgi:RNase P/RNase MRP subunit p29
MVQVVAEAPATDDDGEKVTDEGVSVVVGVDTLAGEAAVVSADVANVKFDTVYALNDDGFVRFPIENVAGIWAPREQFPVSVTVIVLNATFVTSVPVHAPAIPVSAVNVVDPGRVTVDGNPTVMVEPVVRAPVDDGVKPIVHDVATLSTVVAAANVTLVGAAGEVSAETDAGLMADEESEDVNSEKFVAKYEASLIDDGFVMGEISNVPSTPTPSEQGPLSPFGCKASSYNVIVTV